MANFLVSKDGREIALSKEGTITRIDSSTTSGAKVDGRGELPGGVRDGRTTDLGGIRLDTGTTGPKGEVARAEAGRVAELGREARNAEVSIGKDGKPIVTQDATGGARTFDPNAKATVEVGGPKVVDGGKTMDKNAGLVTETAGKAQQQQQVNAGGGVVFVNTGGKEGKAEGAPKDGGGGNQKEVVVGTLAAFGQSSQHGCPVWHKAVKDSMVPKIRRERRRFLVDLQLVACKWVRANLPGVQIAGAGGKGEPGGPAGAGGQTGGGKGDPGGATTAGHAGGVTVSGGGKGEPGSGATAGTGTGEISGEPLGLPGTGGKEPSGGSHASGGLGKDPGGVTVTGGTGTASGKDPGGVVTGGTGAGGKGDPGTAGTAGTGTAGAGGKGEPGCATLAAAV